MNKQYRDAYVNYISRWWPNFKEMTVRKFKWREEGTSSDGQRQSRAATPNSSVKFAARKISFKSSSLKGVNPGSTTAGRQVPPIAESHEESPKNSTPEVVDTAL